jgi:DNA-binding transcriptional LysR family regulator
MAKLNLDWLEVFVQIYQTQSVTRAASLLGMEQASASIALNKLRQHFDDRLFIRTGEGMVPTPRAQSIYPDLQEALARIETARGKPAVFSPKDAVRTFRICMTDISEIIILPTLINHLQKTAPGVVVDRFRGGFLSASAIPAGLCLSGGKKPSPHTRQIDAASVF